MPTTTTTQPKVPTQRQLRRNVDRELATALQTPAADWRRWYASHSDRIAAWATDHGVELETAIAMAATVSPGNSPDVETGILSWVFECVANGVEPGADNRPHGLQVPYGYGAYRRAAEILRGDRGMPSPDIKTGNYGRSIADPDSPEWLAIDVWCWRTSCGDPLDSLRPLASLNAGEYREVRRAWQAVAKRHGMLASEAQAVCWVYRRGRP